MNATGNDVGDLVVDAMREDGLLPAKLPEWSEHESETQPRESRRKHEVRLSEAVRAGFATGPYDGAHLIVFLSSFSDLEPFTTAEARKREVLPKLLAEVEAALPVLRAMVAEVQG